MAENNTLTALTALSANKFAGKPMVMTLVAENNSDYTKLATFLVEFGKENARAAVIAANGGQLKNENNINGAGNLVLNGGSYQQTQSQVRIQTPLNNNGTSSAGNVLLMANASSNTFVSVANGSVIVLGNGSAPVTNNIATQGANLNGGITVTTVPQNATNNNGDQGNVSGNSIVSGGVQANGSDAARANEQALLQIASQGGPYRMALRADQFDDLARNFHVSLAARGDEVHVFRQNGDNGPALANARMRTDVLNRAGLGNQTATAAAAATPAATSGTKDAAANTQPANAVTLIDCVITMEPSTALTQAAAPGQAAPAAGGGGSGGPPGGAGGAGGSRGGAAPGQ